MITSPEQLRDLIEKARSTNAVAIDTEFIWTSTYYPRLGLIQLALSDEDCHLIDPLTIEDLTPFGELLADQKVIKIFHDAPQDLAILYQATGRIPKNIFDTRLAAGFAGLSATLSLGNLIQELIDINLPKTETRTNWLKRPLNQKQIQYAMDDVRYLRAARVILINRIIGPEIKSWLQEELDFFNKPPFYAGNNGGSRLNKIKGAAGLDGTKLAILHELLLWREGEAQKADRPRQHIIKDSTLLEIAKKASNNISHIIDIADISDKKAIQWGDSLLAAIRKGLNTPPEQHPIVERSTRLNKTNNETLQRLNEFIRLKSKMQGIDHTLVGNSSELKKLVKILNKSCKSQMLRQMEGWRKTFLKDFRRYSV